MEKHDGQGKTAYLTPLDQHGQEDMEVSEKRISQYRGVFWNWKNDGWVAVLYKGNRKITASRTFEDEEEAARFFDKMVKFYGAPKKLLNFPGLSVVGKLDE